MKKVIIIGGGVAGLTAGIYSRLNGYDAEIIEKNTTLGGACTGWYRKGCYIDGCIHWLTGVNPKNELNTLWRETGALTDDTKIFFQNELYKFKYGNEKSLTLYADLKKFEQALIDFAPEDEKQIKKLTKLIKKFQRVDPPCLKPVELMNIKELLKIGFTMLGSYIRIVKTSKISCEQFSKRFKNPRLRDIIEHFMAPKYNLMSMLYMLGHITAKDGGIPIGGSIELVKRMEERFKGLGGKITKAKEVESVIIENDTAKGVVLNNGESICSDWVLSTVPVEHCLTKLLKNKYSDKKFDSRLNDEKKYPIYTYSIVAIKCPISIADKSLSINVRLNSPIKLNKEYDRISIRNYSYDTSVQTKKDYCVLQATVQGDDDMYRWWKNVKHHGDYKLQKTIFAEEVLKIVKEVHPDVSKSLEIIDVVTPCTYKRYLNSRHGSFQGFIHTNKGKALMQNGRIKGLKNFILSGQWIIRSGGLPPAVMSGRFAVQRMCHTDKIKFCSEESK